MGKWYYKRKSNIFDKNKERKKIGLIFQQFHLIHYLTALENVMVAQYYHSIPDEQEALQDTWKSWT